MTDVVGRRYACRACDAIVVVLPRGVARGRRYSLWAIAAALAWWAYDRIPAASVRERTSTAKTIGAASATRWASLARWTRCALALFGCEPPGLGTVRERATRVAAFVASHAPVVRVHGVAGRSLGEGRRWSAATMVSSRKASRATAPLVIGACAAMKVAMPAARSRSVPVAGSS
ncbi:MAG: hypothetical protein ACK6DV_25265, partial [Deltaproteobacteria bacterium]